MTAKDSGASHRREERRHDSLNASKEERATTICGGSSMQKIVYSMTARMAFGSESKLKLAYTRAPTVLYCSFDNQSRSHYFRNIQEV